MDNKIIYIDVGNTHIVCEYAGITSRFESDKKTDFLYSFTDITHIIFASVVQNISDYIKDYADKNNIPYTHIHHHSQIGFKMDSETPETVGLDRLINLCGAREIYQGPLLVVDSGTAVTFDLLSEDDYFLGGAIGAGMMMQRDALADYTDALPKVVIDHDIHVIGKQTDAALRSGIYWGHIAQIEGMILRIKHDYPKPLTVIGTGGIMNLCQLHVKYVDYFHPDLIMRGLKAIYKSRIF